MESCSFNEQLFAFHCLSAFYEKRIFSFTVIKSRKNATLFFFRNLSGKLRQVSQLVIFNVWCLFQAVAYFPFLPHLLQVFSRVFVSPVYTQHDLKPHPTLYKLVCLQKICWSNERLYGHYAVKILARGGGKERSVIPCPPVSASHTLCPQPPVAVFKLTLSSSRHTNHGQPLTSVSS